MTMVGAGGGLGPAGPADSEIHYARGYAHRFRNPAPASEPGSGVAGGKNVELLDSSEDWLFRQNDNGVFIRRMLGGYEVGELKFFPTAKARDGFLRCDGSAVSRTTYAELFAEIGTTYGAGDGVTTFNLPNDVDAALVGGGGALVFANGITGANTANIEHQHTTPAHQHDMADHTHAGPSHAHSMGHDHSLSAHTHTGPSHQHSGPSHAHSGPNHNHSMGHTHSHDHGNTGAPSNDDSTSVQVDGTLIGYSADGHTHGIASDATASSAASTDDGGTGDTGLAGTGNTGSAGTGSTGGPSTANTGGASNTTTGSAGTGSTGGPTPDDTVSASPTTNASLSTTQSLVQRSLLVFAYIYHGVFSGA